MGRKAAGTPTLAKKCASQHHLGRAEAPWPSCTIPFGAKLIKRHNPRRYLERAMRILKNGGGKGQGHGGGGTPEKPDENSGSVSRSSAKWLYIWAALTALCFLVHLLFLFLVEPLKVLALSKAQAYAYSGIPLLLGIACFLLTILSFRKITPRFELHIAVLIGAIIFAGLNIQGVIGIVRFLGKDRIVEWVRAIE
jgi:hypothetical protein